MSKPTTIRYAAGTKYLGQHFIIASYYDHVEGATMYVVQHYVLRVDAGGGTYLKEESVWSNIAGADYIFETMVKENS